MDWKWLYTSFEGRIGRKQFWIGGILLAIASIVVSFIIMSILGVSLFGMGMPGQDADTMMSLATRAGWGSIVNFIIFAWPVYALCIKRRHDRGAGGMIVLVSLGISALSLLVQAFGLGYQATDMAGTTVIMPSMLSGIIGIAGLIVGIYLLVVLGFLKGDASDNTYGPNPLAAAA